MKSIKFFSFALLLSLAWVACKNAGTAGTESTAETAEVLSAEVLAANKTTATQSLTNLQSFISAQITEVETALSAATDATKADLSTQLETLKKFQADLQAASAKINDATIENWSTVANEVEALHASIKTTVSGALNKGGQGSSLTN